MSSASSSSGSSSDGSDSSGTTQQQQPQPPHWVHERMRQALEGRRQRGTLRRLPAAAAASASAAATIAQPAEEEDEEEDPPSHDHHHSSNDSSGGSSGGRSSSTTVDFSSNDYLGLARDPAQLALVEARWRSDAVLLQQRQPPQERQQPQQQRQQQQQSSNNNNPPLLGATGSRLLSGDSAEFHRLEAYLAAAHSGGGGNNSSNDASCRSRSRSHRALLCNSGYDANLAVVSSLPCDAILYDEHAHNSLHMGMRLWQHQGSTNQQQQQQQQQQRPPAAAAQRGRICQAFRHNSVSDLRAQLRRLHCSSSENNHRKVAVLVESVYSMEGSVAPLREILDVAEQFGAVVVVDEAHGLGVYGASGGLGVLEATQCQHHPALLAAVYTFGKAAGCHGAAVVCSNLLLRDYLINYGYPLIYSTALPRHALVTIRCAYDSLTGAAGARRREAVFDRVRQFRQALRPALREWRREQRQQQQQQSSSTLPSPVLDDIDLLPSTGPIQALRLPGNAACTVFCEVLWERSQRQIRLFPIKSPTVPVGRERVRVVLHAHNTAAQVATLVQLVRETLQDDRVMTRLLWRTTTTSNSNHHHHHHSIIPREDRSIILPPRSKL